MSKFTRYTIRIGSATHALFRNAIALQRAKAVVCGRTETVKFQRLPAMHLRHMSALDMSHRLAARINSINNAFTKLPIGTARDIWHTETTAILFYLDTIAVSLYR